MFIHKSTGHTVLAADSRNRMASSTELASSSAANGWPQSPAFTSFWKYSCRENGVYPDPPQGYGPYDRFSYRIHGAVEGLQQATSD